MKKSNATIHGIIDNPEWQLLAEYPLSEFISDPEKGGDLTTGLIYLTLQRLGPSLDYPENIEMTLTGIAKEALVHLKQGCFELPVSVRVFCCKQMVDEANSGNTTRSIHAGRTIERSPPQNQSSKVMNGGWGYFIVERSANDAGSSERPPPFFDLYLYQEGK